MNSETSSSRLADSITKTYHQPEVFLGDIVLWKQGVHFGTWAPAVVTQIHDGAVSLAFFAPESRQLSPRSGVKHITDPALKAMIEFEEGVWDHTQRTKLEYGMKAAALERGT